MKVYDVVLSFDEVKDVMNVEGNLICFMFLVNLRVLWKCCIKISGKIISKDNVFLKLLF